MSKTAVLYARVSTQEQAEKGYSLAQQIEALREYAAREGYEVLEEIPDAGHSGASLERPGLDHVRDRVQAGGVSVVLTQDRDRFSREPAFRFLLEREFAEKDTKIRAIGDRGDDSPEGQLTDAIMDQLAKFERSKIAERSRRGKLRKAREGKVVAGHSANFGFSYTPDRNGYVVREEHMTVVKRVFEMVAAGTPIYSVKRTLEREGVPSPPKPKQPEGGRTWSKRTIRDTVLDDLYRPLAREEVAALVSPQVAATLEAGREYGVWWFNRRRTTTTPVSEVGPDGHRVYRKRQKTVEKPRDEWIAVPVDLSDSGLSRATVDAARLAIADNVPTPATGDRFNELRGLLFCSCSARMVANRVLQPKSKKPAHYYRCPVRQHGGKEACPDGRHRRAEPVEAEVWEALVDLTTNPRAMLASMDALIERERGKLRGDPGRDAGTWLARLESLDAQQRRARDLAVEGLLDRDDLRGRLEAIAGERKTAERELEACRGRTGHIDALHAMRASLRRYSDSCDEFEAGIPPLQLAEMEPIWSIGPFAVRHRAEMDGKSPEERHEEYRRLGLRAEDGPEGLRLTWSGGIVETAPSSR